MKLVTCGKCGARFDVASKKPGTKFPCGKCRTPVAVPADGAPQTSAPVAEPRPAAQPAAVASTTRPKAAPKLPPAMQARAQTTTTARAAGAAPAVAAPSVEQAAPAAPRASARPRREPAAEGKKAPVALIAGIGGGILLIGAAAFALSGGGKKNDTPPAPTGGVVPAPAPTPAPVEAAKPKDPTVHEDFVTMPAAEQHDALEKRFVLAKADAGLLEQLHQWLSDPKVKDTAEAKAYRTKVLDEALKLDPASEWAHVGRGDQKIRDLLQNCRDTCKAAFQYPDAPENLVLTRLRETETKPWADAVEYARVAAVVQGIQDREERMKNDPRFKEAEHKRDWVRRHPIFSTVELTWIWADPYVIFQEVKKWDPHDEVKTPDPNEPSGFKVTYGEKINPSRQRQNEDWARKGKLFAERDGIIFTELNRHFRELWAERFKLPTLSEKGRILTGIVMWNRASFDKILVEAKQPVSPWIRAYYAPAEQKIFHYLGDDSLTNQDETWCAENRVQKHADQVTFHEGTHQLQHEYSAIHQGKPLKDDDSNVAPRKAMWFEEGLAEFMGAVEVERDKTEFLKDVHWVHNRVLLERIGDARSWDRDRQASDRSRELCRRWRIKEMMKPDENGSLVQLGERLGHSDTGASAPGPEMANFFYCRAWALCHFLWYYDNGKYREKFNDYLGHVMKGTQSSEKFAKQVMKRPSVNDWGAVGSGIETEYEWYWDQLLSRKVGLVPKSPKHYEPKTDAPTGKVEDDPDWLESWKENCPWAKSDKAEAPKKEDPPK